MITQLTKEKFNQMNTDFLQSKNLQEEFMNNPFAKVLVYLEDEQVIGYLYYSDIYDRAEINQIEIESLHRNCGKASELLQKMIETVEKDITLEVKKDNISALRLYQKFNFQKQAIRKGYYEGIDAILMERKHKEK